jgi:hypothetical protein
MSGDLFARRVPKTVSDDFLFAIYTMNGSEGVDWEAMKYMRLPKLGDADAGESPEE